MNCFQLRWREVTSETYRGRLTKSRSFLTVFKGYVWVAECHSSDQLTNVTYWIRRSNNKAAKPLTWDKCLDAQPGGKKTLFPSKIRLPLIQELISWPESFWQNFRVNLHWLLRYFIIDSRRTIFLHILIKIVSMSGKDLWQDFLEINLKMASTWKPELTVNQIKGVVIHTAFSYCSREFLTSI